MNGEQPAAHFDPLVHVAQPDVPDPIAEARAAAGRAIRDIGHAIVGHHASIELIDEVASALDGLATRLTAGAARARGENHDPARWGDIPPDGSVMTSYEERPVSGRASPWGLDLQIVRDGQEAVGNLTLRRAHEGAPGRSHGGIVAALFDDVFGFILDILGVPAFTGELGVRYEAGTPIGVPLTCRVRLADRSGRKLLMNGELTDAEGRIYARGTATFITVEATRFTES
jgi:acyl-coenzyme A thioesterase PaaI-like protein